MCIKKRDKRKQRLNCKFLLNVTELIFHKCHVSFMFPMLMYYKYLKIRSRRTSFELLALPEDYLTLIANNRSFINIDTCAVINSCLHRIIFNSSPLGVLQTDNTKRIVQFCPSDAICGPWDNVLGITPTLMHNIAAKTCTLYPIRENRVKICSELNLSLIGAPKLSDATIQAILKRFFRIAKLLHCNDSIKVNLRQYAQDLLYLDWNLNAIDGIYLKCNRLTSGETSCSAGIGVFGVSTLNLTRNEHEKLPCYNTVLKKRHLLEADYKKNIIKSCPPCLEKYLIELERAIRPFSQENKCFNLRPLFLLSGPSGSGKEHVIKCLADKTGFTLTKCSLNEVSSQSYAQTEVKIKTAMGNAVAASPCIVQMNNFEEMCKNNEGQYDLRIMQFFKGELEEMYKSASHPIIVICVSNSPSLSPNLERLFLQSVRMQVPSQEERQLMLEWILDDLGLPSNDCQRIAGRAHGFVWKDLQYLVAVALDCSGHRPVSSQHLEHALDVMQAKYNDSLGAPKVPQVNWSDVGGLQEVKAEIIKTISLPLRRPELFESGLKRSGILLYGPPGTGKTLMAKAVATECNLCFLSVKGPELLNMYIGQSEQNIREVFQRARNAAPCIVFFDELDSLAPNRGLSGDSGGVMDRVVSQLLAEMDGLNENRAVFIIGATNRPDLIDPALLRPGRFDKLLYIGPCTSSEEKLDVLRALTRKFNLSAKLNLELIIRNCPKNITGADFYGICSKAWLSAASRVIKKQLKNGSIDADGVNAQSVVVTQRDFEESVRNVKPSVDASDLKYFERLLAEFNG